VALVGALKLFLERLNALFTLRIILAEVCPINRHSFTQYFFLSQIFLATLLFKRYLCLHNGVNIILILFSEHTRILREKAEFILLINAEIRSAHMCSIVRALVLTEGSEGLVKWSYFAVDFGLKVFQLVGLHRINFIVFWIIFC